MQVKVGKKLAPSKSVMRQLGVDEHGAVQQFATDRILFHMRPFMPWLTGLTATSLTQVTSPTAITVNAPYALRLYSGVSANGTPLNYTKTVNPLAGPYWDRTMIQHRGKAMAKEIEMYARSRAR